MNYPFNTGKYEVNMLYKTILVTLREITLDNFMFTELTRSTESYGNKNNK